jgi:hypothetical protein
MRCLNISKVKMEVAIMEQLDLTKIERNIFRDYLQDGLPDILLGIYFLVIGLLLPSGLVGVVVALFVIFFAPLLLWLKKRITYPRSGYVELRQGDPQSLPLFILVSFVVGLVSLVLVLIVTDNITQPSQWYGWMPIFFGIFFGGSFLGLGVRVKLIRYYVLAGAALAAGIIAPFIPLSGKLANIGLFFAAVGLVWLTFGVITLIRFLRKYPLPPNEIADVPG